jgi:hypothetical protein
MTSNEWLSFGIGLAFGFLFGGWFAIWFFIAHLGYERKKEAPRP